MDEEVKKYLVREYATKIAIERTLSIKLDANYLDHLRSGLLICQVMNILYPRSVPLLDKHSIGSSEKLKIQYINFFTEACSERGLKKSELFLPSDLYTLENPPKVFLCLKRVFHIYRKNTKDSDIPSPTAIAKGLKFEKLPEYPKQRDYNKLKIQLNEIKNKNISIRDWKSADVAGKRRSFNIAGSHREKLDLSLFENYNNEIVTVQSIWRMYMNIRSFNSRIRKEAHRENIARELLKTESVYVDNLQTLIDVYLLPLKEKQSAIQVAHIYAEIEVILAFSKLFLESIQPIIENWNPSQSIGHVILEMVQFMKVYTQYIKDYSLFLECLQCNKDQSFKKLLDALNMNERVGGLNFGAFLIMPIQRIPRYELLLRELWSQTPIGHRDYENISTAYMRVKEIAVYVNEEKRSFENSMKVIEIQSMFGSNMSQLSEPHRKYISEHTVYLYPKLKPTKLFFFNDLVLIGKPYQKNHSLGKEKKYKLVCKLFYGSIYISELQDNETSTGNFHISSSRLNKPIQISSKSTELCQEIISSFNKYQDEIVDIAKKRGLDVSHLNDEEFERLNEDLSGSSIVQLEKKKVVNQDQLLELLLKEAEELKSAQKVTERKFIAIGEDPRSKFMKNFSQKITPHITPKQVIDMYKEETQNQNIDLITPRATGMSLQEEALADYYDLFEGKAKQKSKMANSLKLKVVNTVTGKLRKSSVPVPPKFTRQRSKSLIH